MKGYLTSYAALFETRSEGSPKIGHIEVPLIQRDYAQGRTDASAEEIRVTFLEALLDAIAGGQPLSLDFVYGRVEEGTLYPLDGQQRLTTLFLLHWYLGSAVGRLHTEGSPPPRWTNFSYSTRPGARMFCQQLATSPLPSGVGCPSDWIADQSWYLHVWRNDPTIRAMLVMIDAIHVAIRELHPQLDLHVAWEALTRNDAPSVSFYLLPLDDMESDEDLYIKMNSRGKPLTPFENFKARFEQDISHSTRADEFAFKIDGAWSDLMWPYHGGDNIVDDEFLRYLDFLTEICELREGTLATGRFGARARLVFGSENPRAVEHLALLFDAFDVWESRDHVTATFDALFGTAQPGDDAYDTGKTVLFGATSPDLFELCCHSFEFATRGSRPFTLQQSLLLYAVLLYVIHRTQDFPRRLRILRNLIAASEDEIRRDYMPGLVADVEQLVLHGDLSALKRFSSNQIEDEQRKQAFVDAHRELAAAMCRLEDSPILRGTLSCFDLDAATFAGRARAFESAFGIPEQWHALTGALLATGDYQRRRPKSPAWQFGTGSPTNEAVWRELLTDAPRVELEATRTVLAELLDGLAASSTPAEQHLNELVNEWLAGREAQQRFDWRYYLIKYQSRREGVTGIYFGVDGELGYSLCMLRTKQRNGLYRDPILLEIWRASDTGELVDDPWFTGYETNPRWLRLVRSQSGIRNVAEGFELAPPEDPGLKVKFQDVCNARADIVDDGGRLLLTIPQLDRGAGLVDATDRVIVGASFLRTLVDSGL